jgi:hypothetical protein
MPNNDNELKNKSNSVSVSGIFLKSVKSKNNMQVDQLKNNTAKKPTKKADAPAPESRPTRKCRRTQPYQK